MKSAPALLLLLSFAARLYAADGTYENLTVNQTTTIEGPIQIDDTAAASTAGQWNVTLENGLFIWGDSANSQPLNLDFDNGDELMFYYPDKNAFRVGTAQSSSWDEANIGQHSVVLGSGTASGDYATVLGSGSASGVNSVAMNGGGASGDGSISLGPASFASGWSSVSMGVFTRASGDYALALGGFNIGPGASGYISTVRGDSATATADYGTAWGRKTLAEALSDTAIGQYNIGGVDSANNGATTWLDLDPLFEIGNGSSSLRTNAMTVIKNGQTTLTNKYWDAANPGDVPADPNSGIAGDQSSAGEALVVEGHSRFLGKVSLEQPQGDVSMGVFTAQ